MNNKATMRRTISRQLGLQERMPKMSLGQLRRLYRVINADKYPKDFDKNAN